MNQDCGPRAFRSHCGRVALPERVTFGAGTVGAVPAGGKIIFVRDEEYYPQSLTRNFHIALEAERACLSIASEFTLSKPCRVSSKIPARSKVS
jgi:hypothetical protein